jgi:betaine-aldehyde dehydrogenase
MSTVTRHRDLFIGGAWTPSTASGTIDVVSPNTGEVIGEVPDTTVADVERAVAAARSAFDEGPWPTMAVAERVDALRRLSAAIGERGQEIADCISSENGSPAKWSIMGQVLSSTMVLDNYATMAEQYEFVDERTGGLGQPVRVNRLPVGVVAGIVPWNVPLFIAALKIGPAFAAGAPLVLKASPETPLDAYLLAECAESIDLPPGVLNVLPADRETSEHLVRHPGVDKVAFTGSTATGRRIGAICGENLTRFSLELGGKSAAIVLDDADLEAHTAALVESGMLNNGQACGAQTRILAPVSRYDEVIDALATTVASFVVGNSLDPATDIGPMVTARQRDKVLGYLESGKEQGARAVVGGSAPAGLDGGWFVEPTVFADVHNDMTIAREEIFGPVLSVIPYDGEDDAVRIANDSSYGLCGSIWTGDVDHATQLASRIRTGCVAVNTSLILDFCSPFGGFKDSGIGRELGPEGIDEYVELQSVILPGA